jgi:tetratricopeptide (TPR) repeat protein
MMSQSKKTTDLPNRRLSDQTRLESWKSIANYLHRSVRTVRRWEGDQGLPVHRHKHASGSSVHAYCAELDAWRSSHQQSMQQDPAPARRKLPQFGTLAAYIAVVLVAGAIGVFVGKYSSQDVPYETTEIEERKAWVLIAAPVNHDGYREVGDSLRAALLREIGTSSYPALPQQRVQNALRLMRRDPKTALSPELAREVALRDGQVSALLIPRLEQLGDSFVVSVEVIDAYNDQLIAYPSEKTDDIGEILPAFDRLAQAIGTDLSLIPERPTGTGLPHVTTSSLSALQLYSQAYSHYVDGEPMVAHELLDLALIEDPDFASALALQAWTLQGQGPDDENVVQIAREATDLNGPVTPAERYFIDGSYRHLSGDAVRADASYRALLDIEPDHLLGSMAILDLCLASDRPADCVDHKVRLADIQPDNFEYNIQAAWSLAAESSRVEAAKPYAERALVIWRSTDQNFSTISVARVLVFPLISAWSAGDIGAAVQESERLTEALPTLPIDTRNVLIEHLVESSTVLGRIDEAKILLESLSDPEKRRELRARFLFAAGNKVELKDHLASDVKFNEHTSALLMAISGLPVEAQALHDELRAGGMSNARGAVIRARIAFGNGALATAQTELETAVVDLTLADRGFYFVGHDLLATVLNTNGQLTEAIHVLERTSATRDDAAFNSAGLYWMMCQRKLARLYREASRDADATLI